MQSYRKSAVVQVHVMRCLEAERWSRFSWSQNLLHSIYNAWVMIQAFLRFLNDMFSIYTSILYAS